MEVTTMEGFKGLLNQREADQKMPNLKAIEEKIYSDEYAQALHFLINLYMCNGCAMKSISDYMKKNNITSK